MSGCNGRRPSGENYQQWLKNIGCLLAISFLSTGCATQQGYQGAGVGAVTGATAGILLDPDNRWRGAVIGGSLGATLGGTLADRPTHRQSYNNSCPSSYRSNHHSSSNTARGTLLGGVTGATAGALLDHDNRWRGGLIGGALGSFFGGSISSIPSSVGIPVLAP